MLRAAWERPLKVRRYVYLTIKLNLRHRLAWIGLPTRQYPQFRRGNTFMGAAILKILKFAESVINVFGLGGLGLSLRRCFLLFVNFFKKA